MRWDVIKQAWALAKEKFPDAKRLFVSLPDKFRGFGECSVVDLDKPDAPLGKITYEAKCESGRPVLSMKLEEKSKEAALPKTGCLQMNLMVSVGEFKPRSSIPSADIMAKFPDHKTLGEKLAYLMIGHEDGIAKGAQSIHEGLIESWIGEHGFPKEAIPHAEAKLAELGVVVARKKRKRFENFEKVRVVDPRLREYNEGAQVLRRKRDKEKHDWYAVLVDGSDTPIWLRDEQIEKNNVGSIKDVSMTDRAAEE